MADFLFSHSNNHIMIMLTTVLPKLQENDNLLESITFRRNEKKETQTGNFPMSPQLQVRAFLSKPGCGQSQSSEDEGHGISCCQHLGLLCPSRFLFQILFCKASFSVALSLMPQVTQMLSPHPILFPFPPLIFTETSAFFWPTQLEGNHPS